MVAMITVTNHGAMTNGTTNKESPLKEIKVNIFPLAAINRKVTIDKPPATTLLCTPAMVNNN